MNKNIIDRMHIYLTVADNGADWWNQLSKEEQEKYLSKHKNSKFKDKVKQTNSYEKVDFNSLPDKTKAAIQKDIKPSSLFRKRLTKKLKSKIAAKLSTMDKKKLKEAAAIITKKGVDAADYIGSYPVPEFSKAKGMVKKLEEAAVSGGARGVIAGVLTSLWAGQNTATVTMAAAGGMGIGMLTYPLLSFAVAYGHNKLFELNEKHNWTGKVKHSYEKFKENRKQKKDLAATASIDNDINVKYNLNDDAKIIMDYISKILDVIEKSEIDDRFIANSLVKFK